MSSRTIRQAKVLRHSALALALAVGLGGTGAVLAQSTSGSIFGSAQPGQTVTATGTSGVTRSVTVDQSGRYTISSLPVGDYKVTVATDGAVVNTRDNVSIKIGSGTEVSFAAKQAADAQDLGAVTVSANALPSIDVTAVDSRTVITSQQLAKLPLARGADAIAQLAPGVVGGSSDFASNATGKSLSSFGGAGVTENAYYINGMNVTDPLNGLGGIELPYGSIEQQEVLTGGYGAAYGRSDGGVINQVGKRGTNEWHFGAQILFTPKFLSANPTSSYYGNVYPGGTLNGSLYDRRHDDKGWEAVESAYVGGPLIKDKLFMFASVEADKRTTNSTGVNSSAAQQTKQTYHDPKWYAKLDWNITDNNIFELTAASTKHEYEGQKYEYNYDDFTTGDYVGADVPTKTSSNMWIAKYTGYITDDFTVSAQFGKQVSDIYQENVNPYADLIPILGSTLQNPALNGGTPITNANKVLQYTDPSHQTRGANYRIDLTYKIGDHTITAGIDNQRTQDLNDSTLMAPTAGYAWQYGRQNVATSEISDGEVDAPAGYPGGANGYFVDKYVQSTSASTRVDQRAQYIEDSWQVNDRWLVKIGLRNDQFTNYNPDNQAYITQTRPQWAPRLGFSWDVFGDSSFKVYGNAGRYYLALPTSVALRGAAGSLYTKEYYTYTGIDANGAPTGLTPINTYQGAGVPYSVNREYGQQPDPNTVTAKNLKAQNQDEYILGFDKVLNDKLNFGMKATFRRLNRIIDDVCDTDVLEGQAIAQGADVSGLRGCYFFNPGSAADFQLPNATGGYQQVHISNADFGFPHPKRKYYALDTYLEHPFDGTFWGRITYTFSKSYGNSEGQVKSDIGQADIAATQDWDFPSIMQYGSGRLPNDHKHQVKAYGTWQINPEWNVSGILTMATGGPISCEGLYGPDQTAPAYDGNYYHWCGGVPSPYGSVGSTPTTHIFSINGEYRPAFADHKLAFNVNVYNLFNEQKATRLNPDYSDGNYKTPLQFETPRYVRFGITYDF